jgi:protein associated with RNAse G/E
MLPTVEVYKMLPDGSQWGQWQGFRLPISAACPTVWSPLGTTMRWRPATWNTKTHGLAFFWPEQWYVIHAFYDLAGDFAGCYCDIVTPNPPVSPNAPEMRYTDLYIDVVVRADHSVFTKDQEVYARAMQVNPNLAALHDEAFGELDQLAEHARAWTGPFVPVVAHLTRTDWETLDPTSTEFAAACAVQWNGRLTL